MMLICRMCIRMIQTARLGKPDASDHGIRVKTSANPVFR